MRVVIIARIKENNAHWIDAVTFDGRLLRFQIPAAEAGTYQAGDVWLLDGEMTDSRHPASMTVRDVKRQPPLQDVAAFAAGKLPLHEGQGGLQGAGDGLPDGPFCWQSAAPLKKENDGISVVYVTADGVRLPYIGLQEPLPQIGAGTLLYLTRAADGGVQLGGWVQETAVIPDFPWEPEPAYDAYDEYAPPPDILAEPPPRLQYESPLAALKEVFGYDVFRNLQEPIIRNVLAGKDSVAVMPTGSGKSLCYQLPALLLPGLTVVVSPLISLMEDQVAQLRAWGIAAAYLNSTLTYEGQAAVVDDVRRGRLQLLYAAPETLLRPQTKALLAEVNVSCLTIDEAHCISQWGHDFRPEYQQLALLRAGLPDAVCLALTATATPRVREDILLSLGIPAAQEFIASFDRDNLHLQVAPKVDLVGQTLAFLEEHREQSGIIYCATRKQVDTLSSLLDRRGWGVRPYHAGLDNQTRRDNQTAFIRDDIPIIVATIAFGMGINKPDVRFILHVDLPQDIESYYQQIGRAGRDGLTSDCLLLYSPADLQTINFFISQMPPELQQGARQRLEAMMAFAQAGECRRKPLLSYFDEEYPADNCELCDNCLQEAEDLTDLTIPAQKFLSCVKRTGEMFGMMHIIAVLRGSRRKAILKRGHDRLSTYNIGGDLSKDQWRHLATQFLQQGLLVQDVRHGGLSITAEGWVVLRGQDGVSGTLLPEAVQQQTRAARTGPAEYDRELFQRLRERRKALGDEADVPPYVIFPDRTLVEMAHYFPQTEHSFAELYGVGQAKLRKYAAPFLELIREYCAAQGIVEKGRERAVSAPPPQPESLSPRTLLVGDYLEAGMKLSEIAAELDVKPGTVLNHLTKLSRAGHVLPLDYLRASSRLSPQEQERVFDAFAVEGSDLLRPVYEALEERVSYDELRLQRILYLAEKNGG